MISDRSEFRVHIRRLFVIVTRTSYRWICSHPFLLGFVGVLYLLHRACPLLFSPLLAASPVLFCTFVLLGTLLSFGEPHIPEIETEPETTVHESALFTTEVSRDPIVVERGDESFTVERFVSTEKEVLLDGNDDADRLVENQLSEVDYRPLVDEILDEVKRDTQVRFEERAFALDVEKRGDGDGEEDKLMGDDEGKRVSHVEQSRKNGGSLDETMNDSKDDQVDVSPVSPWRPMRHEEGEDDDDADRDDSLDSSSDGAESSSPDPSMTDIIPMLDELHPLLHSENPGRGITDLEGSDATSEGPDMSSTSDEGVESDVNSQSHGEEGDNKNEEEEEEKEEKDDESKSAITWTEADQKNVMDLASLELERNQRLESLIARRRARNNMRMIADRNLIDFDTADVPFNMPPISTARHNPFDLPYDDDMGLPPIPGSAPSIMFARRNPFDLPYEPNEEKPDLKGDGFEEEFSSPQRKEPMFRRHESFSVGPSMLGGPRHDRLRPFFALERLANEGRSYYPFERQLSEVSESKVSSVPDTESVCTILEDEEKKVGDHEADRETDIAKIDMTSDHDEENIHSSEDSDLGEQADSKNHHHHHVAEIILGSAETHVTHHDLSNIMDGETSDKSNHDEEDSSDSDSSLSEIEDKADISENEDMLISERKVDLHEKPDLHDHTNYSVQLLVSDAKEETHPNQTMDIEVDSVDARAQNVGSEETTPSESDREPTWSHKSVVEQTSIEPGEDQEPAAHVSVVFSRNITFHEYHDAPEDTADLSCLTSDKSSSPAEFPEYETPMVGEGSKAEFFQETVNEGLDHVVERLDQLTDLHEISQNPPEVITEEADEIKEIDEGLLSELDTIGDFGVKEVVTDSEPGPSSVGSETAKELTEALPILEARSVEDIESAFEQIHEGPDVEDVILPSTIQDKLAQENSENSAETKSDLTVVEATSKDDIDTAMNQAVVESMGKQPMSPELDGGSGEVKCAVEMEPSGSLVEERSLDETNVNLNNTPEKEEEEESIPKERTTSDVSSIETRSLEEISKTSETKEEMVMEVITERVVIPTEAIESSNVTLSDEVVTEESKAETSSNHDGILQSPESKETPEDSGESISEQKVKTEEKKEKGKSDSSSSSSSSSSSDSD